MSCVTSYYDPAVGARVLIGPNGILIPTPGTLTKGINEGIQKAVSEGWAFRCLAHEQVVCDDGIKIPPCAFADIDLGSTEFYIKPGVIAPGLHMSSFNGGRFNHSGFLIYDGDNPNAALYISPANADPRFGQKIIQNADISFGWVNALRQIGCISQIDLSQGMIYNNKRFEWQCLQGWDGVNAKANYGIIVTNPGGASGVNAMNMNFFRVGQLFGFSDTGILIGDSETNADFMSDNNWDLNINIAKQGSCTSGVTTWGSYDYFDLGVTIYSGTLEYPMIFRPGTTDNRYLIRQATAQFGVSDSGTNNRAV